jgi:hypothetical protein
LSDRSDFKDLYQKYWDKSENYLFSFERFDVFQDIISTTHPMKVYELFDGRFYEFVILIIVFFLAVGTFVGLSPSRGWGIAHKMNSMRVALCLAITPGIVGRAYFKEAVYWYFRYKLNAHIVGKMIAFCELVAWIVMSLWLLVEVIVLLMNGLKDYRESIYQDCFINKSKKIINIFFPF